MDLEFDLFHLSNGLLVKINKRQRALGGSIYYTFDLYKEETLERLSSGSFEDFSNIYDPVTFFAHEERLYLVDQVGSIHAFQEREEKLSRAWIVKTSLHMGYSTKISLSGDGNSFVALDYMGNRIRFHRTGSILAKFNSAI